MIFVRQKIKKEDLEKKREEYNEEQAKYEMANIGEFRLIYPSAKMQYYDKFYNSQPLVYQETKASRNRAESARLTLVLLKYFFLNDRFRKFHSSSFSDKVFRIHFED